MAEDFTKSLSNKGDLFAKNILTVSISHKPSSPQKTAGRYRKKPINNNKKQAVEIPKIINEDMAKDRIISVRKKIVILSKKLTAKAGLNK